MKTTVDLPDQLFRRAKIVAAQRGTTMKELVIAGLRHALGETTVPVSPGAPVLTPEEAAVATIGPHGLPVLKRPVRGRKPKVTTALVDRIRNELGV